jgi:hypothetical protein
MAKVKTVRVGRLNVKAFAARKPIALGAKGKLITLAEAAKKPISLGTSLASLDEDDKAKLVFERNRLEPDFTLGIVDYGNVKKKELLEHIKQRTPLGKMAIQAELSYVEELMSAIAGPLKVKWPKISTIKPSPIPTKWRRIPKQWWKFLRSCVLFCENTTDSVTKLAAAYRKKYVHPIFKKRGFCVIVLEGINDVPAEFIPRAKSRRVVYISGVGHGNPTTYTGHLGSHLLEACQYDPAVVKQKSIHLLSCKTAQKLGPDTIKKGARSYSGYYQNFTFVFDNPATPVNELNLFWKADSTYDIAMALGRTAKQAGLLTIMAFNAAIAQVPGTAAAAWLKWDRDWLRTPHVGSMYGSPSARIAPYLLMPFFELEEALEALAV